MKKIAIVGAGPTGIYTLQFLLERNTPLAVSIFEQERQAGVGMPYNEKHNSRLMLANVASIEIPPVGCSYLEWLQQQETAFLARYEVDKGHLHSRQFLPRLLLGEYLRNRFRHLVKNASQRGCEITVNEACKVTDLEATPHGVKLWSGKTAPPTVFDFVVIATGHVWSKEESSGSFFPSPWSGLLAADIPPCRIGIMGTSLSAIDAAMAVATQHGEFIDKGANALSFVRDEGAAELSIALMSRSGILPEADFYCPIPYEPLEIGTAEAIEREIAKGKEGLLDRTFKLIARELECADPAWCARVSLRSQDLDSFAKVYFSDRKRYDPFRWAEYNLQEVERNKRDKHTVGWRYAILRLHETVQSIVPHLDDKDLERFNRGLRRVFIDNYAAIPPESIRRLLALRDAGLIDILELGDDYKKDIEEKSTLITVAGRTHAFDIFIDARGQRPLKTKDIPFPTLRKQLLSTGADSPDIALNYTLLTPTVAQGRIALAALPYLIHDHPFVQGIANCAEIGETISHAIAKKPENLRKRRSW